MTAEHRQLRTALASFPRSGNTWLRYLIELATGESSGSMYEDRILPRGREGVVIKTHLCNRQDFDRAIHLVRNPFDAIESYFHWKRNILGDVNVEWEQHVRESVVEWREHTTHWMEAPREMDVHLMRYESLRADPQRELRQLLQWMGFDRSVAACAEAIEQAELQRMRKLHPTLGEKFFRKGSIGEGREAFSSELVQLVHATLSDLLAQFGYDRVRS